MENSINKNKLKDADCKLRIFGVERGDRKITIQTLEKFIEGLKEAAGRIFKFGTPIFNNKYFKKK